MPGVDPQSQLVRQPCRLGVCRVARVADRASPLERSGDFTKTFAANGQQVNIFNPFSTRPSGSGFVRDPFPGNTIPTQSLDPVAVNTMKYYPAANTAGNPITNANNFYKQSYSSNLSRTLKGLVAEGKLLETAQHTYALDSKEMTRIKAALGAA